MPRGKSPGNIVFSQQGVFSDEEAAELCPWGNQHFTYFVSKSVKRWEESGQMGAVVVSPAGDSVMGAARAAGSTVSNNCPVTASAASNVYKTQFGFSHRVSC